VSDCHIPVAFPPSTTKLSDRSLPAEADVRNTIGRLMRSVWRGRGGEVPIFLVDKERASNRALEFYVVTAFVEPGGKKFGF
jgi:hypothetical protein